MFGSKIDNLKKLIDNQINVPEFFVIKNDDVLNINIEDVNLSDTKKASTELKQLIKNNIKISYKNNLKTNLYAVRSSCNLEDGSNFSFAGQFDTYLRVKKEDLDSKIEDCFLSLYNENVLDYIKENNIDIKDLKMNVIVQKMISSRLSGVLFTSNPQGIINESVIVVSLGDGENVVQDKGITTSYYYNNTDNVYYYEGEDILSLKEITELLNVSSKIKELLGEYLDIEFTYEENKLYILQARKITTIDDSNILVMDNSNIVESYPNISLPITVSFVNSVYSSIFKRVVSRVLKNDKKLKNFDEVFNNMVGSVNGRIYYKISNWYTLLKLLPFSKKIIPIWQDMLGVKVKTVKTNEVKVNILTKTKIIFNFIYELLKVKKNMINLNLEFVKIKQYFDDNFNENLSNEEILKIYNQVEEKVLNNWDITLINDMYAFIYTGLLKKSLKKKYKDNYESITNELISGISNIESLKPIKELIKLAYIEKDYSTIEFEKLKKEYISNYGDRSLEELKLESKTFRTNNELLDQKIAEYQSDEKQLENIFNSLNTDKNINIKTNMRINHLLKKVTIGISNREISRLNRSRIYGMVRSMFIQIGKNLESDNILEKYADIFYLSIEEIKDIKKDINYKELVKSRKGKYKEYEKLPAYSRLVFMNHEFDKLLNNIKSNEELLESNVIKGTPCSNGCVEGYVLVVDNINNIGDVKGKILVTKMTDPGWVFLLTTSLGVISEKGSLLSHTAIISRELKIPAIVGVENIMKKLKTGDYIKMDANRGEIIILKRG